MIAISVADLNSIKVQIAALSQQLRSVPKDKKVEVPITKAEFMRRFDVKSGWFHARQKDGTLPTHKIGGKVYVYLSEVNEVLRGKP